MRQMMFFGVLAVAIFTASTAFAGAPTWCSGTGGQEPHGTLDDATSNDVRRAARGIVQLQCYPRTGSTEDSAANRERVEAARHHWTQQLGLVDTDWEAAAAFAVAGHDTADLKVDSSHAWSTLDGFEQYAAVRVAAREDLNYLPDAIDDRLTQIGRLAVIETCLESKLATEWMICISDIERYDPEALVKEARADRKHAAWERFAVIVAADALHAKFEQHAANVKAILAKDPAYAKLLDVSVRARKAWDAHRNPELLALALAMDDARVTHSRKAVEGCEDKTWAAWRAAVSAIPASRFSTAYKESFTDLLEPAAAVIVGEPDAYLAAVALVACHAAKPDLLVQYVRAALFYWPGSRGPRGAAHLAIVQAGVQLDDRDARLEFPPIDRRALFTGSTSGGGITSGGGGYAPVKVVKAHGASTHVEFTGTNSKETECVSYRPGKRLSRIGSSGRLVFEGTCLKYALVTQQHSAPDPVDTPSAYVPGLKVGMVALVMEQVVLFALPKPGATAPSLVLGVEVK